MPAAVAAGIFCPGCDHIHCSARVKCALRHPLFQYAHPPQRQARARRDLRQLRLADWNPRRRGSTRRTGTQWARRAPCDKTRDISPTTLSNVRQTPRDDRLSGRQIWTPCPQLETKVAGALHQVETTPKKCPFAWPNWPGGSASFHQTALGRPPASGGCRDALAVRGWRASWAQRPKTPTRAQRRARLTPWTVGRSKPAGKGLNASYCT